MASERVIMNWVSAGRSPPRSLKMSANTGMMKRIIPIRTRTAKTPIRTG